MKECGRGVQQVSEPHLLDETESLLLTRDRASLARASPEVVPFRYCKRPISIARCCFGIINCFSMLSNLQGRRRDPVHEFHSILPRMHHDESCGASSHLPPLNAVSAEPKSSVTPGLAFYLSLPPAVHLWMTQNACLFCPALDRD